ncbi:MAG: neuromedin U [Candidatus Korobacteraceae bacterium]
MRFSSSCRMVSLLAAMLTFSLSLCAQEAMPAKPPAAEQMAAGDVAAAAEAALEKEVQNPVSELISVPLQNNTNFAYGPYSRTQNVLNIQPVIPINLNENWMIKSRTILPLGWQPYAGQTAGGDYGLGDMTQTFFLSPRHSHGLSWGIGPAFIIPTATSNLLGQGKFSLGPSIVALAQPGHWTVGALINNLWSVAGSGGRPPVNQMQLQAFVVYQMKKGWYVTTSPILGADWRASNGNVWTVPLGGGVGRITRMGPQRVNLTAQLYGNAAYPAGTSPWSMRLQLDLLFPKGPKE